MNYFTSKEYKSLLRKAKLESILNKIIYLWNSFVPSFMMTSSSIENHLALSAATSRELNKKEYVLGFLFNHPHNDMVVLIKKQKPDWQKDKLNGVGGKIEPGETPVDAMIREFKEETGLDMDDWRKFAVLNHSGNIVHCFTTSQLYLPVEQKTSEEVGWFKIEDIGNKDKIRNLKWLIPMALDKDNIYAEIKDPSSVVVDK